MKLDSGSYLRTDEAKTGDVITFLNEGTWVENTKYTYEDGTPKQNFIISVTHKSTEKKMRLNKTSRDAMVVAYDNDTAAWVGKPAIIDKQKVMVGGKMMECIFLQTPAVNDPLSKKDIDDMAADQEKEIPF